jgi:exoribonuclease-2
VNPGQIVEFIEGGRTITAVCLEERKTRIWALTEHQREVNIAPSRIIQTREALVQGLRERSALRETLAARIDVKTIWEVLHEERGEYPPKALAELAFEGKVEDDHTSGVIRAMLADRVFFRFRVRGFRPNDSVTVNKILTQKAREQEKERQIESGSKWIMAVQEGKAVTPPEGWEEIVELLKEYAIYGKGAPRARRCEELLKRAGMNHTLAPFRTLVKLGIWSSDENLLLHRFSIRRAFAPEVQGEARMLQKRVVAYSPSDLDREDLQTLKTFTIDSPHTRDLDDALSLERFPGGYQVGVHIADVSSVVPIGSPSDVEAAHRGTSIYLPEERIPMFPLEISEDVCSLKESAVRPAVSLLLALSEQGKILGQRFTLAWIRVHRRLSYEEADEIVKEANETLGWLYGVARTWRKERARRGALLLPLPEVAIHVDKQGKIVLERRDRESPAQIMVSEMMIQANWLVAQRLHMSSIPCIYRTQGEPRENIIENQMGDLFLNYQQRKLLSRAEFQLEPGVHHGLGVEAYTTVTSPIRRYVDLLMQRQLTAAIKGEPPPYGSEDLQKMLMSLEEAMGQAMQVEQSRQRYWLLCHLEGEKGKETPALVLGRYGNRYMLLLTEYMVEASVPAASHPWLQPMQEIPVRIIRSKPLEDELRVEPCASQS